MKHSTLPLEDVSMALLTQMHSAYATRRACTAYIVLVLPFLVGMARTATEKATPDPIKHQGLTITLREIASIPGDPERKPRTRINYLFHAGPLVGRRRQ